MTPPGAKRKVLLVGKGKCFEEWRTQKLCAAHTTAIGVVPLSATIPDFLLFSFRFSPQTPSDRPSSCSSASLQTEKRESDTRVERLQREADRLRATLWSHGINPVSNVAGSNANTNPAANGTTRSLAPKGSQRGAKNAHGRRREKQHLDAHRQQKKKLAPLSYLGGGSGGSGTWGGSNSSTASAAVIGFRNRASDLGYQAPREWRHK